MGSPLRAALRPAGAVPEGRNTCEVFDRPDGCWRNSGKFPVERPRPSGFAGLNMPHRLQGHLKTCGHSLSTTPTAFLRRSDRTARNPPAGWPEYPPRRTERPARRLPARGYGPAPMRGEGWRSAKGTRPHDRAARRVFLPGCRLRPYSSDSVACNGNERQACCFATAAPDSASASSHGVACALSTIGDNDRLPFHSSVLGLAPQSPIS